VVLHGAALDVALPSKNQSIAVEVKVQLIPHPPIYPEDLSTTKSS
jgi:hypothetical protein